MLYNTVIQMLYNTINKGVEKMEIYEWTSRIGKHYVTMIERIEGVPFWKQPEKVSLCLDTNIAYARSIDWAVRIRKYALENNLGEIKIRIQKLPDPNAPKKKRGRKSKRGRRKTKISET